MRLLGNELPGLGPYGTAPLLADVLAFEDHHAAVEAARKAGRAFRDGLRRTANPEVDNPSRRSLFTGRVQGSVDPIVSGP